MFVPGGSEEQRWVLRVLAVSSRAMAEANAVVLLECRRGEREELALVAKIAQRGVNLVFCSEKLHGAITAISLHCGLSTLLLSGCRFDSASVRHAWHDLLACALIPLLIVNN